MTSLDLPARVHFLTTTTVATSTDPSGHAQVLGYGSELEVTESIIEASRDRFGRSWLEDWLSSGEEEYRRADKVVACRGPWPAGTCRLAPGSIERDEAREAAIREAFALADPAARADRRREIEAYFGPSPTTSRTHATISPGATR